MRRMCGFGSAGLWPRIPDHLSPSFKQELNEATRSGEELRLSLSDSESQSKADKRQISGLEAEISTLKAELQQQMAAGGAAADELSDHRWVSAVTAVHATA